MSLTRDLKTHSITGRGNVPGVAREYVGGQGSRRGWQDRGHQQGITGRVIEWCNTHQRRISNNGLTALKAGKCVEMRRKRSRRENKTMRRRTMDICVARTRERTYGCSSRALEKRPRYQYEVFRARPRRKRGEGAWRRRRGREQENRMS